MKFEIWGLSGSLATQRTDQMDFAEERLWYWLDQVDKSCNRFRSDSEISRLNASCGDVTSISSTFQRALRAALDAANATQGLCDPTVLPALLALGYDVDYDELILRENVELEVPVLPTGVSAIHLDEKAHRVQLDAPCQLDLGSSAKALLVDLVANDVAPSGGVVVELGGDVALRGEGSEGPWVIGLSDSLHLTGREPRIAMGDGGVATSSITTRTWRAGNVVVNHIVDPRTGSFAKGPYATASVSARSCVLANAFATAALLWGEEAGYHIAQAGWSGRLIRHDGTIDFVGGWPEESVNA
ncbi:MAG TPA: FAD:protein FMN transferase [Acidimicrobiales bacterium]